MAFTELPENQRERWMKIPLTGCDGLPKTGQAWVRNGLLAATIYIRPNTDLALEMLVDAIRNEKQQPEHQTTVPQSFPSIDELAAQTARTAAAGMRLSVGV